MLVVISCLLSAAAAKARDSRPTLVDGATAGLEVGADGIYSYDRESADRGVDGNLVIVVTLRLQT